MKKTLFLFLFLTIFQGVVFSQSFRDVEFSKTYNYPVEFISYYKDLIFEAGLPDASLLKPLIVSWTLSDLLNNPSEREDIGYYSISYDSLIYILKLDLKEEWTPLKVFQKGVAYLVSFKDKEKLTRVEEENLQDFIINFFDFSCGCGYFSLEEDVTFFVEILTKEQIDKLIGFKGSL